MTRLTGIAQGMGCRGDRQAAWTNGSAPGGIFIEVLSVCPSCSSQLDSSVPHSISVREVRRSHGHQCDSVTQNEL